jgi:hypothetical protein
MMATPNINPENIPEEPKKNVPVSNKPLEPTKGKLVNKIKAEDTVIRPLRTYEDDVKNAVTGQNISTTKILLAEQKRRDGQQTIDDQTSVKNPKNRFLIAITVILVVGGVGAFGYGLVSGLISPPSSAPEVDLGPKSFIDTDSQIQVVVENRNIRDIFDNIAESIETALPEEDVQEIYLTKTEIKVVDGENVRNRILINSEDFFNLIESRAPDTLIRALGSKFMFGLHSLDVNEPFVIFTVNDFNNAFAGMLEWEDLMVRDVKSIFFNNLAIPEPQPVPVTNIASTTATTTDEVATSTPEIEEVTPILDYDPRGFEDLVISNRDTRVIKNTDGEILYFYSFIDSNTLILTSNKDTLIELLKRLRSASLIRG